jgi:hypothetical protein
VLELIVTRQHAPLEILTTSFAFRIELHDDPHDERDHKDCDEPVVKYEIKGLIHCYLR